MSGRTKPSYEKAKKQADKLLSANCLNEPPVNAKELAIGVGLQVIFVDFNGLTNFENVSGFIDSNSNKMYVNANEPSKRQNFTIAHELGHFLLGHTNNPEYKMLYRNSNFNIQENSPLEQEANCFAANLLVPERFLKNILKEYPYTSNTQLADVFFVSEVVIRFRRQLLGV